MTGRQADRQTGMQTEWQPQAEWQTETHINSYIALEFFPLLNSPLFHWLLPYTHQTYSLGLVTS